MDPAHIRHIEEPKKWIKKKIMVFEDNEAQRELYKAVLEREGFNLILKSNCVGGLQDIKWDQPHALILDIMMPEMDGITFLQMILAEPSLEALPILIISDLVVDFMEDERCPNNVHLLRKPFKNSVLVEKIKKIIQADYKPREKDKDDLTEIKELVDSGTKTSREVISKGPYKIMIFEDEPAQAELYLAILNARGYMTILKTNPIGGIEDIMSNSPDLIMMDIMMPGMTGLQFLEQIKKEEFIKKIPILMVSSLIQDWMSEGDMPDNVHLMKKPIKQDELLAKIRDLIKLYSVYSKYYE
ncbi:response regulator [Candidatus Riflebacteria bacterium]